MTGGPMVSDVEEKEIVALVRLQVARYEMSMIDDWYVA